MFTSLYMVHIIPMIYINFSAPRCYTPDSWTSIIPYCFLSYGVPKFSLFHVWNLIQLIRPWIQSIPLITFHELSFDRFLTSADWFSFCFIFSWMKPDFSFWWSVPPFVGFGYLLYFFLLWLYYSVQALCCQYFFNVFISSFVNFQIVYNYLDFIFIYIVL